MSSTRLAWPVYGFSDYFKRETVAHFFDYFDAASFVGRNSHSTPAAELTGFEGRNLYIGKAVYL